MTTKSNQSLKRLREEAEAKVGTLKSVSDATREYNKLLHELHVHQIELEMQNEQLLQVQVELEESRDHYLDLYELAPVGYLTIDANDLIHSINLKATSIFGKERRQIIQKPLGHFIAKQHQDYWYRQRLQCTKLDLNETHNFDLKLEEIHGKEIYANFTCIKVKENTNKNLIRITIVDISERKEIEQDLRIAATAFETQEGIMITDALQKIIRVNKAFTEMTGYSSADVIGKSPKLLQTSKQSISFYQNMWGSINQTGRWDGEIWNKRKNGETYPQKLTISEVKDNNNQTINYVATMVDITHHKKASERIKSLAFYDALTNLPNRRLFLERLPQALAISERTCQHGAVLFLDIDNFKLLNDTLGHDLGDQLLKQISQRLLDNLRQNDIAARMGGDEFVILLEDLSQQKLVAATQAKKTGNQILDALNSLYILENHSINSSVSIGITLFGKEHPPVKEILKQADIAMYQAKAAGRNSILFFDPIMQEVINKRAQIESDLQIAIKQQQFELYLQPQVNQNDDIFGVEALIRWNHPKRGQVPPLDFIATAEDSGLILEIGQWVLESACQLLEKWRNTPIMQNLCLSINVSAKQFNQIDFVEHVKTTVNRYDINTQHLNIELTESVLLNDIEETIHKMNALKKLGIGFELDDFGTGYSSLQYLKKLPLHQLKIDQSFVQDITSNHSDRAIVSTIIAMAKTLDLQVIAEGVETKEHHTLLISEGCRYFQGYYFKKPMSVIEFETLIKNSKKQKITKLDH